MVADRPSSVQAPGPVAGGVDLLPGQRTSARSSGYLLVIMAAVLWGAGGPAAAIVAANSQMSWSAISALRLLAGGIIMLVVTGSTGELRRIPRTRESVRHIVLTAVLMAVAGIAYFQSLAFIGVAVATVLSLGAAPLTVAAATAIRHRRAPGLPVILALVLAVAGLVLVSDVSAMSGGQDSWRTILGVGVALLSGVVFGGTMILNRRVVPGLSPAPLIATSFTLAGLLSLPVGVAAGLHLGSVTWPAWWALVFLALVQTMLGYTAFHAGLQRGVPATSAAILSLLEPLAATVLAVLILHEPLSFSTVLGMSLLLTAVVLVRPPRVSPARKISATGRTYLPWQRLSCVGPP